MLERAQRAHQPVALLYLDLDRFKVVNDTLGHATGDEVLQSVVQRLGASLRASDSIGKLGGDEFVVLVEDSPSLAIATEVAQRLLDALDQGVCLSGQTQPLVMTTSIGIAWGHYESEDRLFQDADLALYEAKYGGRNQYVTFSPEVRTRFDRRTGPSRLPVGPSTEAGAAAHLTPGASSR